MQGCPYPLITIVMRPLACADLQLLKCFFKKYPKKNGGYFLLAYFFLNLSIRPAVSTNFTFPV